MAPSDILISDVGAHKLWLGRLFPAYEPNTVIVSNGFATHGHRPARAPSRRRLAVPERRVVAVSGDGGFLMNVQEMETATRLGRAGRRGRLGGRRLRGDRLEAGAPLRAHPRHPLRQPRLRADLARAFGWSHRHATDGPALARRSRRPSRSDGPALVTVPIDYRQNARLTNLGEPALGA